MSNGAISVHKAIRTELENYIQSQYFGKSMLLLNAVQPELDKEGLLYKRPYIESSPAYKSSPDGIEKSDIPDWMCRRVMRYALSSCSAVRFHSDIVAG